MMELDQADDADLATQLKADDDFLHTPVDDDAEEESDSGAQVIALDTEQFDDTAATMQAAGPAVLEEDDFVAASIPAGMACAPMVAPHSGRVPEEPETTPLWQIVLVIAMFVAMVAGLIGWAVWMELHKDEKKPPPDNATIQREHPPRSSASIATVSPLISAT